MKTYRLLPCLLVALPFLSEAQVSGNQVFGGRSDGRYNYHNREQSSQELSKLYLSDTAFLIQAKVLKNVAADFYIAAFGLSDTGKTVARSNTAVNARVARFIAALKATGFRDEDIYTDIITQYRVYDFRETANNTFQEYLKGFELSKNIIIRYSSPAQVEKLLTLAAQEGIFDLIKVDYFVSDISKIYEQLFEAAAEVIKKKRTLYQNLTAASIQSAAQIYNEQFSSHYPIEQYRSYKAYSGYVYDSYNNDRKKMAPKFETFYYDKVSYAGYDKVINTAVLEPVIEFTLTLQVKYNLKK